MNDDIGFNTKNSKNYLCLVSKFDIYKALKYSINKMCL